MFHRRALTNTKTPVKTLSRGLEEQYLTCYSNEAVVELNSFSEKMNIETDSRTYADSSASSGS